MGISPSRADSVATTSLNAFPPLPACCLPATSEQIGVVFPTRDEPTARMSPHREPSTSLTV